MKQLLTLLTILLISLLKYHVKSEPHRSTNQNNWYDCSSEIGITPHLKFLNITSIPPTVTPTSGQIIYKTLQSSKNITKIKVNSHQYYKLFNKYWITFLIVHNIDECAEHDNLCPMIANENVTVRTVHPPLNKLSPFGWYRSRQVYEGDGDLIGCVDMKFEYCSDDGCEYYKRFG